MVMVETVVVETILVLGRGKVAELNTHTHTERKNKEGIVGDATCRRKTSFWNNIWKKI
jgi:hypothetical protein